MHNILAYRLSGRHLYTVYSNIAVRGSFAVEDTDRLLHWLIFSNSPSVSVSACLRVAWSLSDFANLVLPNLPESVQAELSRPPHRAKWGNYKLFYAPEKVFSINKNGSEANFYDLSQYFPDESEPGTLSELQRKADQLQDVLSDLGLEHPTSLASPVAAFKGHKILAEVESTLPTIFDAPANVLDAYGMALQCTPREWISNYQVGHFPKLWSYDLSSAYSYEASHLLDLRDCVFTQASSDTLPGIALDKLMDTAYYGFLVGDFTVYPDHPLAFCSPFLTRWQGEGTIFVDTDNVGGSYHRVDDALVNFVGTERNYSCLLDEVRTLYRYQMGEFKLIDGWFVSPASGVRPRVPFQTLMGTLYAQRGVTELKSYFLKRVMNGLVGKLLEARKDAQGNVLEYGERYNPIYHALCTTRTRLKVFDFLVQNAITREELVHIGVDGAKVTRDVGLPSQAKMGGWRCSGREPAIVLSPGAVITPSRNFKRTGYAELLAECATRSGASKLGADENDPIDLRRISLNQTRVFAKLPRTGGALLSGTYLSDPVRL